MGVVCCVRIDFFKAVLGFSKLDAAFMFPAGARMAGEPSPAAACWTTYIKGEKWT